MSAQKKKRKRQTKDALFSSTHEVNGAGRACDAMTAWAEHWQTCNQCESAGSIEALCPRGRSAAFRLLLGIAAVGKGVIEAAERKALIEEIH